MSELATAAGELIVAIIKAHAQANANQELIRRLAVRARAFEHPIKGGIDAGATTRVTNAVFFLHNVQR
jgi:hypothetical protein